MGLRKDIKMYREYLNPEYFKEARYINEMVDDLFRCERAIDSLHNIEDVFGNNDISEALYRYHLDLQMELNDYMDKHFYHHCCKKNE